MHIYWSEWTCAKDISEWVRVLYRACHSAAIWGSGTANACAVESA